MPLNLWKVFVVTFLLEEHFIFKQGVPQVSGRSIGISGLQEEELTEVYKGPVQNNIDGEHLICTSNKVNFKENEASLSEDIVEEETDNRNFEPDKFNLTQNEASLVRNSEGYKRDDLQKIEGKSTFQTNKINLNQNEAPLVDNNDKIDGHNSFHPAQLNLKQNKASLVSNTERWKHDEKLQFGRKKAIQTNKSNVNENEVSLADNTAKKDNFQSEAYLTGNIEGDRHTIEFKELGRKNVPQDNGKNTFQLDNLNLNKNDYTEGFKHEDYRKGARKSNFQRDESNLSQNHASLAGNIEEDKHEIESEKLDGKNTFQSNKFNLAKNESPSQRKNDAEKAHNDAKEEEGKSRSKLSFDKNEASLKRSEVEVLENSDTECEGKTGYPAHKSNWRNNEASLTASGDGENQGNGFNSTENKEHKVEGKKWKDDFIVHPNVGNKRKNQIALNNLEKNFVGQSIDKEKLNAKVYELEPDQINEKKMREIIGNSKRNGIPHCSIKEYETHEKWEQMALAEKKQGHLEKRRDVRGDLIYTDPPYFSIEENKAIGGLKEDERLEVFNELRKSQVRPMENVGIQQIINEQDKQKRSINSTAITQKKFPLEKVMFANPESSNVSSKSFLKATENVIIKNNPVMRHAESKEILSKRFIQELPHIPEFNQGYKIINFPSNIRLVENDDVPEKYIQLRSIFPLSITQNNLNETDASSNLIEQTSKEIINESINGKEVGKSHVEYLYTQQVPVSERIVVQNDGKAGSSNAGNKEDCITIMINPKTLQNRVLHAEYMKRNEEKNSPDTLVLNLTPLNTAQCNTSVASSIKESIAAKTNFSDDSIEKQFRNRRDVTDLEDLNKKIANADYSQYFESDTPLNGISGYLNQPLMQASTRTQDAKIELPKDQNWPAKIVIIEEKAGKPHPNTPQILNSNKADEKSTSDCLHFNANCYTTTQDLKNFKELHEGYKDSNDAAYNELYKLNQKWINEATRETTTTALSMCKNCLSNLSSDGKEKKRDIGIAKKSKSIPPIIIMYPKSDEGINMEECESMESFNGDQALIDNSIATKIANKKIENKILEGFINSIISNYTKELVTLGPRKSSDIENGDEIMNILKDVVNKKEIDLKNLNPLIVPQEDIAEFKDSDEYEKFGPFSEDLLKSILSDNSLDSIDLSQHNI